MSTIKVDNLQTTGGAGLYPAKVWVNFNGTGTISIRDDGNVSSLTDNGTGNYTVSFSTAITDDDYSCFSNGLNAATVPSSSTFDYVTDTQTRTTSSTVIRSYYWVNSGNDTVAYDNSVMDFVAFR